MSKSRIIILYNVTELIILTLILISGYVSPKVSVVFSFISFLVFPTIIILLILSIIKRVQGKTRSYYYLIFFVVYFLLYGGRIFQFSINKESEASLKVLSFNVGRFKQSVKPEFLEEQLDQFYKFLEEENIDVICFQEFSFVTKNLKKDLNQLGYKGIMFKNPIRKYQNIRENFFVRHDYFDEEVVVNDENKDLGVSTKIIFDGDTIILLNTHIK